MINRNDPRHGTSAGYSAGCKDDCCRTARRRQQKLLRIRTHQGIRHTYTAAEVDALFAPWDHQGVPRTAVINAAGLGHMHNLTGPVRARAYLALAKVTEDDIPDNTTVLSDLTRRRIYSLMAAGHRLRDLPINTSGHWRTRERIRVDVVRAIRDSYRHLEFTIGPDRCTESRARNAGHLPPLAWDDPDTLAWPLPTQTADDQEAAPAVDDVLVSRVVNGDYQLARRANHHERRAIVARLVQSGVPVTRLEEHGIRPGRYTTESAA